MGPGVCPSLTKTPLWDLTDVTLADEDTNSIQTDDNKAIQGNVAMQAGPPDGQICNWCKKPYLLVKCATYVSGATLWPINFF